MTLNEVLDTRRSIRAFKTDAVSKEQIEEMVAAAQKAPTWKNSQTGRYYVALSAEKLEEVKKECLPEFNANSSANAPALIVTTFEKTRAGFDREGNPDNELGDEWGAYDLGLANMALLLKATELGLGTLVMGIRDGEKLRKAFDIPDSQEVVAVIAVGYPDIDPAMPKRKEMETILTYK